MHGTQPTAAGLFVAGACLACLAGCGSSKKATVGHDRLTPSLSPYFADVPVPEGFRLMTSETSDYMTSGIRYARHVYEGPAVPVLVRDFYHQQMPLSRWTWVNTQSEGGVQTLRFEKEQERCDITVSRRSGGFSRKTDLKIWIAPIRGGPPVQARNRP